MIDEHCTSQLYACISYWSVLSLEHLPNIWPLVCRFIVPLLIVLGISGSLANLAVMSGSAFTGSTFYYLRALSLCDMFYLICVIGTN